MTKFEIASFLTGMYFSGFALMQQTKRAAAALLYKVIPFFLGLFQMLLALKYGGVI